VTTSGVALIRSLCKDKQMPARALIMKIWTFLIITGRVFSPVAKGKLGLWHKYVGTMGDCILNDIKNQIKLFTKELSIQKGFSKNIWRINKRKFKIGSCMLVVMKAEFIF